MTRIRTTHCGFLAAIGILSLCLTGCLVTPQHGQVLSSTSEEIDFWGATVHAGERLRIEARRESGGWEEIGSATTADRVMELPSGNWHLWCDISVRIPDRCWVYRGDGLMEAEIRVVSLDHDIGGDYRLITFENGFSPMEYDDPYEMWVDYGHGRTMKLYAPR
jgi:hypothetical protein